MAELPLFWQRILENSLLLDIETAGLDPTRHTPISAATKRYGAQYAVEPTQFKFTTARMQRDAPFREYLRIREPVPPMEPFAEQMWRQSWAEERAQFLARGGRLTRPEQFFSRMFEEAAGSGGFLWAHNVHFDISQYASEFASPESVRGLYEGMAVPPFYEYAPERSRIWPTQTRQAFKYRKIARDKPVSVFGAMRGWYGEYRTMAQQAVAAGKPAVLDTMLITQGMMAMAQEQGYMRKTFDVFTGSRLEALYTAFGLGEYAAHLGAADVAAMEALMEPIIGTAEALYAREALTGQQAAALYRLGRMQPRMAEQNVEAMFAQAQYELREAGQYRYTARGGEQVFSRKYEDILAIYEKRMGEFAYDMPVRNMWERVGRATGEELDQILAARRTIPQLGMMEELGARARFLKAETKLWWRHRSAGAKVAMGVGAVAALAFALTPERQDIEGSPGAYNTIEGLKDRGNAGSFRQMMTDFGSGWRGLIGLPRNIATRLFGEGFFAAGKGTEAFYMSQKATRYMLQKSRQLVKEASMVQAGRASWLPGQELAGREFEQAIRATRQLQSGVNRAQGVRVIWDDVIAQSGFAKLKELIRHEGLHEAALYGDELVLFLRNQGRRIATTQGEFGLTPLEAMETAGVAEAKMPLTKEGIRKTVGQLKDHERIQLEAELTEEYFAYQFGDSFRREATQVTQFLSDLGLQAPSSAMEQVKQLEKEYRITQLKRDRELKLIAEARRVQKMTVNTMSDYAPHGAPRIRNFASPHLANAGGEGMVHRQFKRRRGSKRMYQP